MGFLLSTALLCFLLVQGVLSTCTSNPTGVNATAGDRSITFAWNPVTGSAPITYEFYTSIDPSNTQTALTTTSYLIGNLSVGVLYQATVRVQATCNGQLSQPLTLLISANTNPAIPELSVNSDDNTDINLVFNHEGEADTYVIVNSFFSGGMVSTSNNYYFVEGLEEGQTYNFEGYTMLNGVQSVHVTYTHEVEEDLVWGMSPFLFSLMWIILIVLVVVIVVGVIVFCYWYKRRKANKQLSRESTQNLAEGDDASTADEKQAWEYKDPYQEAGYRLTETQRKRAFAIAAQKAALAS